MPLFFRTRSASEEEKKQRFDFILHSIQVHEFQLSKTRVTTQD